MRKQRSNIVNAQNAVARSDDEWTKEMGIDDHDLIKSLRISVKDRLKRYEKGQVELEAQLNVLEKRRAELTKRSHGAAMGSTDEEQSTTESATFSYNDSFVDIIKAAKAVAHLVWVLFLQNHIIKIANIVPARRFGFRGGDQHSCW